MSNEKPKLASATSQANMPPANTFGIGGRPRNWLVPVILLSLREWNSYGYELMQRASMFGFEAMNPGTLYGTLRRMEKDGVVESSWKTSGGGPARRMYTITGSGNAHLDIWVKSLERYQQSMDDFFELMGKSPHMRRERRRLAGDPREGGGACLGQGSIHLRAWKGNSPKFSIAPVQHLGSILDSNLLLWAIILPSA